MQPFVWQTTFFFAARDSDPTMASLRIQVVEVKKEFDEAETVPVVLPASQHPGSQDVPTLQSRYTVIAGPVDPLALDNCAMIMSWICENFGGPAQVLRAQLPNTALGSSPLLFG